MHRRHFIAGTSGLLFAAGPARSMPPPRFVLELFTSQSCSSCPPADALLTAFARDRPDVLALSFHVTYWDRLGWRDRFSLAAATERQRRYAATLGEGAMGAGTLYTPQAVIQGRRDAIGFERAAVLTAMAASAPLAVPLGLTVGDRAVSIEAGEAPGAGTLRLVGYDAHHVTAVRGGENGGRTLGHSNVVRSLTELAPWRGRPLRLTAARPEGERVALLLEGEDGGILGAATA